MGDDKGERDQVDPHGTPRKADDENKPKPQNPTEDHGSGSGELEGGDEAVGTGPSGGGDPGVSEH